MEQEKQKTNKLKKALLWFNLIHKCAKFVWVGLDWLSQFEIDLKDTILQQKVIPQVFYIEIKYMQSSSCFTYNNLGLGNGGA